MIAALPGESPMRIFACALLLSLAACGGRRDPSNGSINIDEPNGSTGVNTVEANGNPAVSNTQNNGAADNGPCRQGQPISVPGTSLPITPANLDPCNHLPPAPPPPPNPPPPVPPPPPAPPR